MNDKLAAALAESEDIEAHPDRVLCTDTKVTRGGSRDRVLQVRLTEQEYADIEALAAAQNLPPSTVARSILLAELNRQAGDTASVANRLHVIASELEALASQATVGGSYAKPGTHTARS